MIVHDSAQLGRLIRTRRQEVGLTATRVAELAKVSRRLLTELERGRRRNVGVAAVFRVVELLGLSVDVEARGFAAVREASRGRRGA
jgi:transcriptional regulator with XRE-family HTH domain